jgi:hypothetical protein
MFFFMNVYLRGGGGGGGGGGGLGSEHKIANTKGT